jgi:hypothetical protein
LTQDRRRTKQNDLLFPHDSGPPLFLLLGSAATVGTWPHGPETKEKLQAGIDIFYNRQPKNVFLAILWLLCGRRFGAHNSLFSKYLNTVHLCFNKSSHLFHEYMHMSLIFVRSSEEIALYFEL